MAKVGDDGGDGNDAAGESEGETPAAPKRPVAEKWTRPETTPVERDGWRLEVREGEPTIADDVLAEHLGLDRRKLRELIRRHEKGGNVSPIRISPTAGQSRRGRPSDGFLLTEPDALFVVNRSEAPKAIELTKAMIRVFVDVRRGLLSAATRAAPAPATFPDAALKILSAEEMADLEEQVTHYFNPTEHTLADAALALQYLAKILDRSIEIDEIPDDATRALMAWTMLDLVAERRGEGAPLASVGEAFEALSLRMLWNFEWHGPLSRPWPCPSDDDAERIERAVATAFAAERHEIDDLNGVNALLRALTVRRILSPAGLGGALRTVARAFLDEAAACRVREEALGSYEQRKVLLKVIEQYGREEAERARAAAAHAADRPGSKGKPAQRRRRNNRAVTAPAP